MTIDPRRILSEQRALVGDPRARRIAASAVAGLAAASLMKRSRLVRLGLAGGVAALAAKRLGVHQREPSWHDVPPPP